MLLPLAILIIPIYTASDSRYGAFIAMLSYHMVASRGLFIGAFGFADVDPFVSLSVWLLANVLISACFIIGWSGSKQLRLVNYLATSALLLLPPLGSFHLASPFTGAGFVFPSLGFLGLLLFVALSIFLTRAALKPSLWKALPIVTILLIGLCCNLIRPAESSSSPGTWKGVESNLRIDFEKSPNLIEEFQRQIKLIDIANKSKESVIVFSESILGRATKAKERLWRSRLSESKTVLAGAIEGRSNSLIRITNSEFSTIYFQRQPIPLAMWNPFDSGSYRARWKSNATAVVEGEKIVPLICYEASLLWPILSAMIGREKPDRIVLIGNLWWASKTNIPKVWDMVARSWAKLFGLSLTKGVNL